MIAVLFIGLGLLFAGSILMHTFSEYPGTVMISVGDSALEMSFWLAFMLLVISYPLVMLMVSVSKRGLGLIFRNYFAWFRLSQGKRAQRRTQSGLVHFVEGNWLAAKKELVGAAKHVDTPLVNYLAAARSAHELGHHEETHFLLEQAQKISPENNLAILLSQARMHLAEKKYEACLQVMQGLEKKYLETTPVLDILKQVHFHLQNWSSLAELLPKLKKSGLLNEKNLNDFEEQVYAGLLKSSGDGETGLEKIEATWKALPKALKNSPSLVALYCSKLHELKADKKAEQVLTKRLKSDWRPELVTLYGELDLENVKAQLAKAENWLKGNKADADLYFTLGKLAMKNSLWGKARDYFEASLKIQERPDTYAALGALMTQLGEHQKSTESYRKGLLLTTQQH